MLFNKKVCGIYIAIMSVLITSCGIPFHKNAESLENEDTVVSMEEAPELGYDIPLSTPHILVDNLGYLPQEAKEVFFYGENIPSEYSVYDVVSGKCVYTGNTEKIENDIAVGNFEEINKPGRYYIEADYLGQSYEFEIKDSIYEGLVEVILDNCSKNLDRGLADEKERIWAVNYLLLSYEIFPRAFLEEAGALEDDSVRKNDSEIKKDIPNILSISKTAIDKYLSGYKPKAENRILAAGMLAKFGYHYREYDGEYASECIRLAESFYDAESESIKDEDALFMASTELYRATGLRVYEEFLEHYLGEALYGDIENESVFWGTLTYLNTTAKVNRDYCEGLMKKLMLKASGIAREIKNDAFLLREDTSDQILSEAVLMASVNHIIPNYEYDKICRNYIHYYSGRNIGSQNYLMETKSCGEASRFVFLTARIASEDGFIKE